MLTRLRKRFAINIAPFWSTLNVGGGSDEGIGAWQGVRYSFVGSRRPSFSRRGPGYLTFASTTSSQYMNRSFTRSISFMTR